MRSAPSFQFYASDWAHSVSAMTLEERGAYITLLAWSWQHGPVPSDDRRIAAILGVDKRTARRIWTEIQHKWSRDDAQNFVNNRLESVRATSDAFRAKQSAKGKVSAAVRSTAVPTTVQPRYQPEGQPESNSPISISKDLDQDQDLRARALTDVVSKSALETKVKSELLTIATPVATQPIINGAELRRHQSQHAWCSWPARGGFCVPHSLHSDLIGKSGLSDAAIREWYRAVMAKWGDTPIGDDVFVFWRNEMAAKIGTVTARPVEGKGHAAVSAARQTLLRRHPELGNA